MSTMIKIGNILPTSYCRGFVPQYFGFAYYQPSSKKFTTPSIYKYKYYLNTLSITVTTTEQISIYSIFRSSLSTYILL